MNTEIDIICDRCGKLINGVVIELGKNIPPATGGFYDVSEGSVWHEFAKNNEHNVCDHCMWEDSSFIEKYPTNRKNLPL